MNQITVQHGANITSLPSDKFKRCRVSVNFIWKSNRQSATSSALLPYLLERSCARYPDMTEFSKRLSQLYGAELSVSTTTVGTNRVLSVSLQGIKNEFALNGENLAQEYLQLAFNVAFEPHFENGEFCAENVEIEKEKLREILESEINEKRSYCIRQARRRFFKETPEGIEANGYLDEIDQLNQFNVTNAYKQMIATAQIELMLFNVDENLAAEMLKNTLKDFNRSVDTLILPTAQPSRPCEAFAQEIDAVQGKLCLLFTSDKPVNMKDYTKYRVAVALLGATPTSRLFTNVREKQSLCYYCAAGFAPFTGVLIIDSGVEHSQAQQAKNAILDELDKLKTNKIEQKEIDETKRCLINNIKSMCDSLSGLEGWYFNELMRGSLNTPQQAINEITAVNEADIKNALSQFTLSVEYVLTQKGGANE